jgi:drug/metabolite transporter (DMT)-like permease
MTNSTKPRYHGYAARRLGHDVQIRNIPLTQHGQRSIARPTHPKVQPSTGGQQGHHVGHCWRYFIFHHEHAAAKAVSRNERGRGTISATHLWAGGTCAVNLKSGLSAYRSSSIRGQITRGTVHATAISLWFSALPHLALADTTAISFTGPIFTMVGAAYFLGEAMRRDRWIAAIIGFIGVLIVIGPRWVGNGGWYYLIMLAAAPIFSLSALLNKILTCKDSPQVIVAWQTLVVSTLTLPFAIYYWIWPTPLQWGSFAVAGLFGSIGHLCLTHALKAADMSASQSVKFLDLV